MSKVTSVEQELKTDDSELISAASSPATTSPRRPAGSSAVTSVGSAWSGSASSQLALLGQPVRDHAREHEQKQRQQLQETGEDRPAAAPCRGSAPPARAAR